MLLSGLPSPLNLSVIPLFPEDAYIFKMQNPIFGKKSVKPILHCNAKPLTLGRRVGLDPKSDLFALELPTCGYLKANTMHHRPNSNPQGPNAKPPRTQRKPMGYSSRWVPLRWCSRWPCTFYVFWVNFICVVKPTCTAFPVEYGLMKNEKKEVSRF